MYPPPGYEPALTSLPEDGIPANFLYTAIATATSLLPIGVDMPTPTSIALAFTSAAVAYKPPPEDNGECELLGPFAIFVQGALGILALMALVFKRWRERPQRPFKIWFFDVSKQVVGSVLVHIANLVMSMLSSGQLSMKVDASVLSGRGMGAVMLGARDVDAMGKYKPNPCSFYLLNLAIDTTLGIAILIIFVRILTALFLHTPFGHPPQSIQSGNYGSPPKAVWWAKQSLIYFIGLMGMKFCVLIIFFLAPWIGRVGDWALRWTEGDEALQVIFVMLVFPVIMNATQYYIIDSFIKKQKPEHELISDDEEDRGSDAYEDPHSGSSDEIGSADEDEELGAKAASKLPAQSVKRKGGRNAKKELLTGSKDYDPEYDGESSPTVLESGSSSGPERLISTKDSDEEGKKPAK